MHKDEPLYNQYEEVHHNYNFVCPCIICHKAIMQELKEIFYCPVCGASIDKKTNALKTHPYEE